MTLVGQEGIGQLQLEQTQMQATDGSGSCVSKTIESEQGWNNKILASEGLTEMLKRVRRSIMYWMELGCGFHVTFWAVWPS